MTMKNVMEHSKRGMFLMD